MGGDGRANERFVEVLRRGGGRVVAGREGEGAERARAAMPRGRLEKQTNDVKLEEAWPLDAQVSPPRRSERLRKATEPP